MRCEKRGRDTAAFEHAFDLFEKMILENLGELKSSTDASMAKAAEAARQHSDSLPNADYYIHESSPSAKGTGKKVRPDLFRSFSAGHDSDSGSADLKSGSAGDGYADEADIQHNTEKK